MLWNGEEVEYYWQDHKSHQQQRTKVSGVEFIRRLVQHILPKGFQRVRYFGLHATCLRTKITEQVRKAIGAVIQEAFIFGQAVWKKLGWQARIKAKFGRDPLKCEGCGAEMILWKIWTPGYGILFYLPDDAPFWIDPKPSLNFAVVNQLSFGF